MERLAVKLEMIIEQALQTRDKLPKPFFDQSWKGFLHQHNLEAEWWTHPYPNWQTGPVIQLRAILYHPDRSVRLDQTQTAMKQWLADRVWTCRLDYFNPHPYHYQKRYGMWVDHAGEVFLSDIATQMMSLFQITAAEACGRIKAAWERVNHLFELDITFHEDDIYWAKSIYYEDSEWWRVEDERSLQPKPYPAE